MTASLLSNCKKMVPAIQFEEASSFYWSPKNKSIYFNSPRLRSQDGQWALIHEVAHATLDHKGYGTDVGLLMLEVEAWEKAEQMGPKLGVKIDKQHIQDCLDTYRDWLYARSTCPTCEMNSLQVQETVYVCLNCSTRWVVSKSRFCRPYRMKTPPELPGAVLN